MTKLMSLAESVSRFVRPGMHLNFASTPSRSNAAAREIARQFRGTAPGFVLSATGFHSLLHLLGMLRLGSRYIACFFGDNFPTPRPNPLYQKLVEEGATLEHWSLWSYVSALRAAAHGQAYAPTNSLAGSDLGGDLGRAGKFVEISDPRDGSRKVGLVAALCPDIVFLHAVAADAAGNALFSPPFCEGFYGALGARCGVVVTVDHVVDVETTRSVPHLIALPPHRVLAICHEPFGAHPQPLYFSPAAPPLFGYRDDYRHYRLWREMTGDPDLFERFVLEVLDAEDASRAYRRFVGEERLAALRAAPRQTAHKSSLRAVAQPVTRSSKSEGLIASELTASERMVLRAARVIVRRVRQARHTSILAGIGQSFAAARLAKLMLEVEGEALELMVETGLSDFEPERADPFLLSYRNVASAARLSSVDTILGALTCGGQNACLGVIGAAQIDANGNVNSSFVAGRFLVGSGGANDIASSAREVVVLSRSDRGRLVERVEYITSPGRAVRSVVCEDFSLERDGAQTTWQVRDIDKRALSGVAELERRCPFPVVLSEPPSVAAPATAFELEFLARLRRTSEVPDG